MADIETASQSTYGEESSSIGPSTLSELELITARCIDQEPQGILSLQQRFVTALKDEQLVGRPLVKLMDVMETSTNIRREQIIASLLGLFLLYLVVGDGAQATSNIVGVGYPICATATAMMSSDTERRADMLVYWMVYGAFTLIDQLSEDFMAILPIYFVAKTVYLAYLFMPATMGARALRKRIAKTQNGAQG